MCVEPGQEALDGAASEGLIKLAALAGELLEAVDSVEELNRPGKPL
jgi:hypothetical protein